MKVASNQNNNAIDNIPSHDLILVTGDLHIPDKTLNIPEEIKKVISLKKFSHVLCTGNVGNRNSYEFLKSLCNNPNSNFHIVKGDNLTEENNIIGSSNNSTNFPELKNVKIGDFNITIINGHQIIPWGDYDSLLSISNENSSDIVISGYTHKPEVISYEGKYFINPGSLTGAYSPLVNDPAPSFMIFIISGDVCYLYHYELNMTTKNFDVKKVEINKNKSE